MNSLAEKINTFANTTPIIRPLKWYIMDRVKDFQFERLKLDSSKNVFQIYGVRRSGNHAIIEWIIENSKSRAFFCNDVSINQSPKSAAIRKNYSGEKPPNLLVSYENIYPSLINKISSYDVGKHQNLKQILILRDPFNLFASWYNWKMFVGERFRNDKTFRKEIVDIWSQNAKFYLELENTVNSSFITINYNRWMESGDYRAQLSNHLEITETSNIYEKTPHYGLGSSFKDEINRKSTRLNRFLKFKDNPDFRSIFNKEIWFLSRQIFGEIEYSEELNPI